MIEGGHHFSLVLTDEQLEEGRKQAALHHSTVVRFEDPDDSSRDTHRKVGERLLWVFTREWVLVGTVQSGGHLIRSRS